MRCVRSYVKNKILGVRAVCFFAAMATVFMIGCAAPSPPTPPRAGIPKAIGDLAARQQGSAVVLSFALPKNSVTGDPLDAEPDIDVYRGVAAVAGAKQQTQLVVTVPSAAVDTYLRDGKIQITDALDAAAMQRRENLVYIVKTRTSKKRASADSNVATVQLVAAPGAPGELHANVTENAIELSWSAPAADASGVFPGAVSYRVYRGELNPAGPQSENLAQAKLKVPLALIGSPVEINFRDEHFEFGANYVYTVRASSGTPDDPQTQFVESADSAPLFITPKDIYPPEAPTGLVAAIVPGTNGQAAYVELSWEANAESDLAGYWVYRSEDSSAKGQRINAQLLLSPAARDATAIAGKHYFYRVVAADQAGNESQASAAIAVDVP
jgi:hypothetical protein